MMSVARSVYERVVVYVRFPLGMRGASQVAVREDELVIISIRLTTGLGTGGREKLSYVIHRLCFHEHEWD